VKIVQSLNQKIQTLLRQMLDRNADLVKEGCGSLKVRCGVQEKQKEVEVEVELQERRFRKGVLTLDFQRTFWRLRHKARSTRPPSKVSPKIRLRNREEEGGRSKPESMGLHLR